MTRITLLIMIMLCLVPAKAQEAEIESVAFDCNTIEVVNEAFGRLPFWKIMIDGKRYYSLVEDYLRYIDTQANPETCFPNSPPMTNELFMASMVPEDELISTPIRALDLKSTQVPRADQTSPQEPVNEVTWSAKGAGADERTIALDFTRGVYELEASKAPNLSGDGYAQLLRSISEPESCFLWDSVTFPASLRIERDCRLYGTLNVQVDYGSTYAWELLIRKVSHTLPPVPLADGWSASGRSRVHLPFELVFEPGVYELNIHSGPLGSDIRILSQSPDRCIDRFLDLPTHVKILKTCRVEAYLVAVASGEDRDWSYGIVKLD